MKTYYPGDYIEVGKQTAREWILDGSVADPFGQVGPPVVPVTNSPSKEFGLVIRGKEGLVDLTPLGTLATSLEISYGPPAIPYKYTCIWNPSRRVSFGLMNHGFYRILDDDEMAWEMAACVTSLTNLAAQLGSSEEKAHTKKVIGDLRIPVYESRLIWARKCPRTEATIEEWAKELDAGANEFHAFLRALYTKKAMLCTLPLDWQT